MNPAFIGPSLEHQVTVDSPLTAPTVLDQPVVVVLNTIPHQDQSVVRPSRTQQRIGHPALVVHQSSKIQQNRQGTRLIQCILYDGFVVSDVHVAFDFKPRLVLTKITRTSVVLSQGVIIVCHEPPVLGQPLNGLVGPASTAPEVGLVAVDQLLFRVGHQIALSFSHVVQTFNVASSGEGPTTTTRPLVSHRSYYSLLTPVPNVRSSRFGFVVWVVGVVFDEFHLRVSWHDQAHQLSGFLNSQISELCFPIDCRVFWVRVEGLDDQHIFEVDGETIELDSFGFVLFVVGMSVEVKLLVEGAQGWGCQEEEQAEESKTLHCDEYKCAMTTTNSNKEDIGYEN